MATRFQKFAARATRVRQEMWKTPSAEQSRLHRSTYACLRVIAITLAGIRENRILARSAALSFSSMLSLGPLIAIMVLVSGFVLDKTNPELAVESINKAINFIAPQIQILEDAGGESAGKTNLSEELTKLLQNFIDGSQSSALGIMGTCVLIIIVIQLFTAIEDAFNDIWGVRKGRSWVVRIGLYWTIITLGAVLAFAGLAIIAAEALDIAQHATDWVPSEGLQAALLEYGTTLGSFVAITVILALFYRFIPNTQVTWRASFAGAAIVGIGLAVNNFLTFFYVQRTTMQMTLYGSVSILPVLMMGLFVFWMIILFGGRLTYAVQNARFESNKIAWDELSHSSKESLSLLVLLKICRRFRNCQKPWTAALLAESAILPIQIINSSLARLCDIGLVNTIPPSAHENYLALKYQPARPLDKVTLVDFKRLFENYGETPDEAHFRNRDPALDTYHEHIEQTHKSGFATMTIDQILDECEADRSQSTIETLYPQEQEDRPR